MVLPLLLVHYDLLPSSIYPYLKTYPYYTPIPIYQGYSMNSYLVVYSLTYGPIPTIHSYLWTLYPI